MFFVFCSRLPATTRITSSQNLSICSRQLTLLSTIQGLLTIFRDAMKLLCLNFSSFSLIEVQFNFRKIAKSDYYWQNILQSCNIVTFCDLWVIHFSTLVFNGYLSHISKTLLLKAKPDLLVCNTSQVLGLKILKFTNHSRINRYTQLNHAKQVWKFEEKYLKTILRICVHLERPRYLLPYTPASV